jgi:hypothetical protein
MRDESIAYGTSVAAICNSYLFFTLETKWQYTYKFRCRSYIDVYSYGKQL